MTLRLSSPKHPGQHISSAQNGPAEIKPVSNWPRVARRQIAEQLHPYALRRLHAGSRRYGFLHIGKTGGTSVALLAKSLEKRGMQTPSIFGHEWRMIDIARRHPSMRLSFVIRDPVERVVSAFNSRLRQGRPVHNSVWSKEEAAAFSIFRDADQFLDACASSDEFDRSAAIFAARAISHVRRGYAYHFGSVEQLETLVDRIYCVIDFRSLNADIGRVFEPLDIAPGIINESFKTAHTSPEPSADTVSLISPESHNAIKDFFSDEYQIYERLASLAMPESSLPRERT